MYRHFPFGRNGFDFLNFINDINWDDFNDSLPSNSFRTDIKEVGDKYIMESELPGFEKEDIKLDISGESLVITASHEQKTEEKDDNGKYIRKERKIGSYKRSFNIADVDVNQIAAEYKNGILTIELPKKKPEEPVSKSVEIK